MPALCVSHGPVHGVDMVTEYPNGLYRVVATRSDGTQVVLATRLRQDRAAAIVDALSGVSAFSSIRLEAEPKKNEDRKVNP